METGSRKAVFIDRDGTINEMFFDQEHGLLDSPRRPQQVKLIPHAAEFMKGLSELGYLRIIVTNQPGVAKGTLTMNDLHAVNGRIAQLLSIDGGEWDDLYFSPYHPDGGAFPVDEYVRDSDCRKPGPGMLLQAAERHGLALDQCWMIGDGLTDIQAGKAAGCRTILLAKPKIDIIQQWLSMDNAEPDFLVGNLQKALDVIRENS